MWQIKSLITFYCFTNKISRGKKMLWDKIYMQMCVQAISLELMHLCTLIGLLYPPLFENERIKNQHFSRMQNGYV